MPQRARLVALQAALSEDENELAEHLVELLEGADLDPAGGRFLAAAKAVLEGRRLVQQLDLKLESLPREGSTPEEGRFALWLVARSSALQDLVLDLPPADLRRARHAIDARGAEGMEVESRAESVFEGLKIPAGGERRVTLLEYELPCGRALAVRERWQMDTRSGRIRLPDGRDLPAAGLTVTSCERERLSPLFPGEAVAASAPAERLAAPEPLSIRSFLELALRVAPEDRSQALAALQPVVTRLAVEDPARVRVAEPALRWLSGQRDVSAGPEAWGRYLREGRWDAPGPAADDSGLDSGLDLPAAPRSAR